ncbi:uncharacterized protein [Eucyclogobius newberryi]|uniref:uncharacterized protein n=1 Tax=Eucyclogobius newberryi TaxID=166745 RepID=UPI003B5B44CB
MTRCHLMKPHGLFFLLYLLGLCWGMSEGLSNGSCPTGGTCAQMDSAEGFLQCVGLPSSDTGPQHLHRLRSIMEALMDLYTFMRNSVSGVPVLSLQGALEMSLTDEPLQNEALVHMWLEVKVKPLLQSVSRELLSCLSTKNFSCSTYQVMVQELSEHFSDMDPVRQKWIYDFFMFPFLSRDNVAGCVDPQMNNMDWLMKNFGAFKAVARMTDFSTLNMYFSGLEVLELLTPEQKAALLLSPEVEGLDNGTLHLVFRSLMGPNSTTTISPGTGSNWTTVGYSHPYPTMAQPSTEQVVNGFMEAFRPISNFVHEFVSFTNQRNVSEIRSTSLAQFLLNFSLSEVSVLYKSPSSESAADFDVSSVEDWYLQVVVPVLLRFLPKELVSQTSVSMAFHSLFYLEHGVNESSSELQDVCSLSLEQGQCGMTDVVQDVAHVLHCASQTNLILTEENVLGLLNGLTHRLSSLLQALSSVDLGELASDIRQIFSTSPALTQEHLTDRAFIQTWFRVKLLPLLPDVAPELLSCLSQKNFSCSVYHSIVQDLSEHMQALGASAQSSQSVYENFIQPFLQLHHSTDAPCLSNNSALWLQQNFGAFSRFASITDFYRLNPHFSGVEALSLLSPVQTAQLLLLPLGPTPPERAQVVEQVFGFLLSAPHGLFQEVMQAVLQLAPEVNVPCPLYTQMFLSLYGSVPTVSPALEPQVWAAIEDLMTLAPQECVPENITCPVTQANSSFVCGQLSGNDSWSFSNISADSVCDFPLEKYACTQLENFTAPHLASLLSCDLGGNSSHSSVLWKLLLTRLSSILEQALDLLAATPMGRVSTSAPEILDVLGEMRLSMLTDQELRNSSLVHTWFPLRLRWFLPHASGRFLRCLSTRNISCSSYQYVLQIFSQNFEEMTLHQQKVILKNYILHFLSSPLSGPGCVSMNSSEWLQQNLGPFSRLLPLKHLLQLNPHLNLLDVVPLLTPEQSAEMLALPLPTDKDPIINKLFDFYTQGPAKEHLPLFLSALVHYVPQGNLSCSSYRSLFNRLDVATVSVSLETKSAIIRTKIALSPHVPHGCVIYKGEVKSNETEICAEVNSTSLQLWMDQGKMSRLFCDFTVEQLACASLSALTSADLVDILSCSRPQNSSGSRTSWKLLLSKVPQALDQALDLLHNTTLDPTQAALPLILDAIREIRLDIFPLDQINHPLVIELWFNRRLRPFLSSVSMDFLHCLTTKSLNCSTYEHIVHALSLHQPDMSLPSQMYIYTHFIKVYLTRNNTVDSSCSAHTNDSAAWIRSNLGAFSGLVSFHDLLTMNPDFTAMDALPLLTVRQLAEFSSTPGQLSSPAQVTMVMHHVPDHLLTAFFDDYSPTIREHESQVPAPVRSAMLQVVFDRANLSQPSVPDSVLRHWLLLLRPLLVDLSPAHVGPFFTILSGRNCTIEQRGVEDLNSTISTLSEETQREIHAHIMLGLKGPVPLRCYGDNYNYSFYRFLESAFMGFQFPNLTSILSLMPHNRMPQLLNSMSASELGRLLWRPAVVDSEASLCQIYSSFTDTPMFLWSEPLPLDVQRLTLPCVWPRALSSASPSEANMWFDQSLQSYLCLLTKKDLSPSVTYNSSCAAFQKLVSVMGQSNCTGTDYHRRDVFSSIRAFLTSASSPRCYNPSVPDLSSTAWFAQYIGPFFSFMTLEDLNMFGSAEELKVFTVNPENVALLNHSALPLNLTNYYTELVYLQDSNYNPLLLPLLCRCVAPGPAFTQLNKTQSMIVLHNLTTLCTDLDPQVAAALAGNFGDDIDATTLETLGEENTGLSTGQIQTIPAKYLLEALGTLSGVSGWRPGQARAIVLSMMSSGVMKLNTSSSLLMLGTLLTGVPSSVIGGIDSANLLTASKNQAFIQTMMSASKVMQEIFVQQLIAVNSSTMAIMENVPDDMAAQIPRVLLVTMSSSTSVLKEVNKKKWKRQQVELFFSTVAVESSTVALGSTNDLSSSVLQGFTCTGVRTFKRSHINKLIKSCRRKRKDKVKLIESQLTCMSYYIQNSSDATNFSLIPPDVLLYYDYSTVPASSCRSYFEQLGDADFSVFSSALSYQKNQLFTNCKSCLDIKSNSLTQEQVSVMGNMCCTLDGSYIQDSDPSILEKLKNCPDLTDQQGAAVEALLKSGTTPYGAPSSWNRQTLEDLGLLPLYLQTSFYEHFDKKTKRKFLKYFLKILKANDVSRSKRRALKRHINDSMKSGSRRNRAAGEAPWDWTGLNWTELH